MARQARALATRQRLLDATVSALNDCGYAGATTQEVCRRAEVSRGTLLHHFPTRHDLLIAGLEHVLTHVVRDFVDRHEGTPDQSPDALLAQMWEQWQGPALTAWLELAVAARTTPELQAPMRAVMTDFDGLVAEAFAQLMPTRALPEPLRQGVPLFVFATLNGLAVARSYEPVGHADTVLGLLGLLGHGVFSGEIQ